MHFGIKIRLEKRREVMRRIRAIEEVCIGCSLCEVHCIVAHSRSKDIIKAFKRESPRPLSRLRVEELKPFSIAITCQHCEEPFCVYACLTGALQKDRESGIVVYEESKCIGCWTCILACSYGAIQQDIRSKKVVSKCDLCPELEMPACVANCPNRALVLEEAQI